MDLLRSGVAGHSCTTYVKADSVLTYIDQYPSKNGVWLDNTLLAVFNMNPRPESGSINNPYHVATRYALRTGNN